MNATQETRMVDTDLRTIKKHLDEWSWGTIWVTFRMADHSKVQAIIDSTSASNEQKALARELLERMTTLEKQGAELQVGDAVRLLYQSSGIRKGAIGWITKVWDGLSVEVNFISNYSRTVNRLLLEKITPRPGAISIYQRAAFIEDVGLFKKGSVVQVVGISVESQTAEVYRGSGRKNVYFTVPLSALVPWEESMVKRF